MGDESYSPLDAADFFAEYYGVPRRHSRAMLQLLRGSGGSDPESGPPSPAELSSALLRVVTGVEEVHVGKERHGSLEWLNLFVHGAQRLYPDLDPIPATASFLLHCCRWKAHERSEVGRGDAERSEGVSLSSSAADPALANLLREPIRRSWVQGGKREDLLRRDRELDPHLEGVEFGEPAKTVQESEVQSEGDEGDEGAEEEQSEGDEEESDEVDDSGGVEERKGAR